MKYFHLIFFCIFQSLASVYSIQMPDGFMEDIEDFYDNYAERFKELKAFIKANSSKANDLDIGYMLFTPGNQDTPYYLERTKSSLDGSSFDPTLETKIFIHGFLLPLEFPNDVKFKTKDKMFEIGDYNVIVVNYTQYQQGLLSIGVKNGYLVAQNIANTMKFLMDNTGIESTKFHLLGHSMGGNVAGYVGTLIPNIGRITGLDPSGPIYDKMPAKYRLSYKSANFVDSIHTNSGKSPKEGNGIGFPNSHQDFYPNNGTKQPGCDKGDTFPMENLKNTTITEPLEEMICSHERSEFLFLESITNEKCKFIGVHCPSYKDFQSGKCNMENSKVAEMGFHAKPMPELHPKMRFYLDTNSKPSFCKSPKRKN